MIVKVIVKNKENEILMVLVSTYGVIEGSRLVVVKDTLGLQNGRKSFDRNVRIEDRTAFMKDGTMIGND